MLALILLLGTGLAAAGEVRVADDAALRAALRDPRPGTTILVAPGTYAGGLVLRGVRGRGADAWRPREER